MVKRFIAFVFAAAGVGLFFLGGGYATLGFFALIAGLLVLVRPDGGEANAEADNLRYGDPSRDTTRSDYFMQDPPDGGFGDGGGPL
ncbi:MAG: hypothetical protein R3174_09220 [Gammaproteobacteria bacterium]|nr:hypothetical protein [Gammaproteobacteria bacterium]